MDRSSAQAGTRDNLTLELAATAARLIAEDGCDYATAKRKAAQLVLGDIAAARGCLPENELVETELRRYLRTFGGPRHAALLAEMRATALALMEYLAPFNPYLVGAVLNGTATEHSTLHLQLFTDSAKDVEIFLLDDGVRFTVDELNEPAGAFESIRLRVPRRLQAGGAAPLDAVLSVLSTDAVRVVSRFRSSDPALSPIEQAGRASLSAVRALLAEAGDG
ncbi:MAG: hypothetical protein IPM30_07335 [Burkholderiales bacterium]|jgi:hypothetical protein|nr:hypothetical protein [Burkholderiales bacterium]